MVLWDQIYIDARSMFGIALRFRSFARGDLIGFLPEVRLVEFFEVISNFNHDAACR